MVRVKPDNVKDTTNKKTMYAPMFITRYGELVRCVALELLVEVRKTVRFGSRAPFDTMRFERRISVCRKFE